MGEDSLGQPPSGLAGFLYSIRSRLLVLLVAATLPTFVLAVYSTWHSYRGAVDAIQRDVVAATDVVTSRPASALTEIAKAAQLLAATDRLPGGPEHDCAAALLAMVKVLHPLLSDAVLDGPDGAVLCEAAPGATTIPGIPAGSLPALLPTQQPRTQSAPFLWAALPFPGSAAVLLVQMAAGALVTGGADGPFGSLSAWLVEDGSVVAGDPTQPPAGIIAAALARSGAATMEQWRGARFAFVSRPLLGPYAMLVGVPVERRLRRAQSAAVRHVAEFGLLFVAGLVAMAIGAGVWVVEPVKRLSRAVSRWRAGGPFDVSLASGAPAEAAELAQVLGRSSLALRKYERDLHEAKLRQDLLIQEIHHRVKNNLQIVASLLNLQASRIRVPAAKAEFQAARDRIRALATLHRHLYAHAELQAVDMKGFLEDLCAQLLQAVGETPAGGRIQLDIAAIELRISADQAVPVSLIVTEAVSNAAKYAFPGGRSGRIWVRLGRDAGAVQLTIEDDGVGIPAGRAETESGIRDGIGIQLIRGFVQQLAGKLDVDQENGTSYRVTFPLREARPEHEVA
jgi:two-component sensor histidine kinase